MVISNSIKYHNNAFILTEGFLPFSPCYCKQMNKQTQNPCNLCILNFKRQLTFTTVQNKLSSLQLSQRVIIIEVNISFTGVVKSIMDVSRVHMN